MRYEVSYGHGSIVVPEGVYGGDLFMTVWAISDLDEARYVQGWRISAKEGEVYTHDLFTVRVLADAPEDSND